jgi:hypothetical protein
MKVSFIKVKPRGTNQNLKDLTILYVPCQSIKEICNIQTPISVHISFLYNDTVNSSKEGLL